VQRDATRSWKRANPRSFENANLRIDDVWRTLNIIGDWMSRSSARYVHTWMMMMTARTMPMVVN